MALRKGLKFTSITFTAKVEISNIRQDEGKLDVIITPSDGHAWEEKNWRINEVIEGFKKGKYKEALPETSFGI
jgi:hypothetical protein